VRGEQQRGLATPRLPGDQHMISIHPGLGAQLLKGAGEVLQGMLLRVCGRPGALK